MNMEQHVSQSTRPLTRHHFSCSLASVWNLNPKSTHTRVETAASGSQHVPTISGWRFSNVNLQIIIKPLPRPQCEKPLGFTRWSFPQVGQIETLVPAAGIAFCWVGLRWAVSKRRPNDHALYCHMPHRCGLGNRLPGKTVGSSGWILFGKGAIFPWLYTRQMLGQRWARQEMLRGQGRMPFESRVEWHVVPCHSVWCRLGTPGPWLSFDNLPNRS